MLACRPERVGELLRRAAAGGAGQLLVHREPGLVAERLEHREQVHFLDGTPGSGIFSRSTLVLFSDGPAPRTLTTRTVTEPSAAAPSPDDVRSMLAGVLDPELHASIVDLGHGARASTVSPDGDVAVKVALTTAACPLRGQIGNDVRSKVAGLAGVREVTVEYDEMTQEERSNVMQRARWQASQQAPPTEISATTRVIAVGSGKGGVGKSSITANLAAALAARGLTVGVLDADIWGFSIPRMLGRAGAPRGHEGPRRHGQDRAPRGRRCPGGGKLKVVSMGLLVDDEDTALMWRGLILAKALEQFLVDVRWGDLDYLLIDMPPGTGDIQMALARLLPQAEMLVVTTPAQGAQKVAARVADMARRSYLKVLGVVENMHAFVAPDGSTPRDLRVGRRPATRRAHRRAARRRGADRRRGVGRRRHRQPGRARASRAARGRARSPRSPGGSSRSSCPPVEMAGCTARMFELVEKLAPATDGS